MGAVGWTTAVCRLVRACAMRTTIRPMVPMGGRTTTRADVGKMRLDAPLGPRATGGLIGTTTISPAVRQMRTRPPGGLATARVAGDFAAPAGLRRTWPAACAVRPDAAAAGRGDGVPRGARTGWLVRDGGSLSQHWQQGAGASLTVQVPQATEPSARGDQTRTGRSACPADRHARCRLRPRAVGRTNWPTCCDPGWGRDRSVWQFRYRR